MSEQTGATSSVQHFYQATTAFTQRPTMGPPNQIAPSTTSGNDDVLKTVVSSTGAIPLQSVPSENWSMADFRSIDQQIADSARVARGLLLIIENDGGGGGGRNGETMSLDPIVIGDNCQSNNTSTQTGTGKSEHPLGVSSLGYHQTTYPTHYLDTLINFLKGNIGFGLLAMGDAFKNGGMIFSPICVIIISLISAYNEHLLIRCSKKLSRQMKLQYNPRFAETLELSFLCGPHRLKRYSVFFRKCVNSFLVFNQLGLCCVYIIYVSDSLRQVIGWYGVEMDVFLSISIMTVPVLMTSLIKNLKFIARLSAMANVCVLVSMAVILFYCSFDLPSVSSRPAISDWSSLPLFFGTTIFAFEGICLILPLERAMAKPKQFTSTFGVLNVGIVIVTVLLMITGFMGYLKFGDEVRASLTLNLPEEFLPSKIVICCMMLSILCSYTLQFYVAVEVLWPIVENTFGPFESPLRWEKKLRVLLVFITFVGADIVPHLDLFISLVGAVCTTSLGLIFPPLCHMALCGSGDHRADRGRYKWRLAMDVLTLTTGAVGLTTGVYVSVYETYRIVYPDEDNNFTGDAL